MPDLPPPGLPLVSSVQALVSYLLPTCIILSIPVFHSSVLKKNTNICHLFTYLLLAR